MIKTVLNKKQKSNIIAVTVNSYNKIKKSLA